MIKIKNYKALIITTFIIIFTDQITKYYFHNNFNLYQYVNLIPNIFGFTLVYNEGAAFSLFSNMGGIQRIFLSLISFVVSCGLIYWFYKLKENEKLTAIAITFLFGGAVGNLIDRVLTGKVVDFLLVHYKDKWFFPAFNIADIAINIGVLLLLLETLLEVLSKEK